MPAQVDDVLEFFRLAIELAAWNVHISCYGDSDAQAQIAFLMQWPIIAIAATPLVGLFLALIFKHTTSREMCALGLRRGERSFIDTVLLRYAMPLALLVLFFAFPQVTALAFRMFEPCTTFTDEMGETQRFIVSYRKHYAITCPSSELTEAQSIAWLAIVLYPVGVIVLCALLLYFGRSTLLLAEEGTPYTRSIAFLHAPFRPTFFYFDLLELCKKLLLVGFASLIEPGSLKQMMVAVLVSQLFLVLHLQSLPYRNHLDNVLSTVINLSLCVFFIWCLMLQMGALGDDDDLESGRLSSLGVAVSVMMLVAIVGVLIIAFLLFLLEVVVKASKERAESRQREKWAGCTIEPPTVKWPAEKSYACFLSHYKMEAASDARLMHDMLAKMLRYPVFLDSSNLTDLRQLITDGVADSDVMLVLGTKGLFTRPWCLLEVVHSARLKVPTIIVEIRNSGFDAKESQRYIDNLEETMGTDDPSSLELLHEHLGQDLTELKAACAAVLTSLIENGKRLSWNPNASDAELIACLKDIADAMAAAMGNKLEWKSNAPSNLSHKQRKPSAAHLTCPALHLVCNTGEVLTEARVLQTELAMRLDRLVSITDSAGSKDTVLAHSAEALAVLLSKHVLHEPAALMEVYDAVLQGKPILPICLIGRGYDFKDAQAHLGDLEGRLGPQKLVELRQAFAGLASDSPGSKAATVYELQAALLATLPRIIAVNWDVEGGKHQLEAAVTSVLVRLKTKAGAPTLKKTVLKMAPALRLARAPQSASTSTAVPASVPAAAVVPAAALGATAVVPGAPVAPAAAPLPTAVVPAAAPGNTAVRRPRTGPGPTSVRV